MRLETNTSNFCGRNTIQELRSHIFSLNVKIIKKKKDKAYKKIFKYDGIKIYKARVQSICVVHSRRTAAISCQYLFITFLIRRFPHHLSAERKKDNKMSVQKETIVFLPSNP